MKGCAIFMNIPVENGDLCKSATGKRLNRSFTDETTIDDWGEWIQSRGSLVNSGVTATVSTLLFAARKHVNVLLPSPPQPL